MITFYEISKGEIRGDEKFNQAVKTNISCIIRIRIKINEEIILMFCRKCRDNYEKLVFREQNEEKMALLSDKKTYVAWTIHPARIDEYSIEKPYGILF